MPKGIPKIKKEIVDKEVANVAEVLKVFAPKPEKKELHELLTKKMSACFDREPHGMNSNVDKLVEEIINLFNK